MTNEEKVRVVGRLQDECADAFTAVMTSLQPGMSELGIADALRAHLTMHGITKHWYDVPFNVLVGVERFRIGTTTTDYGTKAPSAESRLAEGQAVFADFAPMDSKTGIWGDWASTCVFRPTESAGQEQLAFLEDMRALHYRGIALITAQTTGADVAQYFLDEYGRRGVTLLDVRNNVGHSMHAGPKREAKRIWLDLDNTKPLGPGVFTVEPGGIGRDGMVIARFEECILIPKTGQATIIGSSQPIPLSV